MNPNEIILLDDSDDEEEPAVKHVPAAARLPTARVVTSPQEDLIDLCDSDNDVPKTPATSSSYVRQTMVTASKEKIKADNSLFEDYAKFDYDDSYYSSDEDPSRVLKKVPSKEVLELDDSSDDDEEGKVPARVANHSFQTSSQEAFSIRSLSQFSNMRDKEELELDDSSDDDDEDLLKGSYVTLHATKHPPPTTKRLTFSSQTSEGTSLSQSSTASLQPKTTPRVVNPYAKAKSATAKVAPVAKQYAKARTPVTNPYAKSASKKKKSRPLSTRYGSDDEDSDLEDMLQMAPTFSTKRKNPPSAKAAAPKKLPPPPRHDLPSAAPTTAVTATRKATTPRPQAFPYPTLLHTSKQHEDVRAKYALALWKYGRSLTIKAHERQRLDQVAQKIVKLSLSQHPVRSLEEFLTLGRTGSISVGSNKYPRDELRRQLDLGQVDRWKTPPTRRGDGFYTITQACLVALWEHLCRLQQQQQPDSSMEDAAKDKASWVVVQTLVQMVDRRLRPSLPGKLTRPQEDDHGEAHYLDPSTRSAEWLQIAKLECKFDEDGPRIKRHKRNGRVCFELLPAGMLDAQRLAQSSFPSPPGHYRTSQLRLLSDVREDYEGICLGVDRQEGGGGFILHEMCNKLDMQKVPYFVGSLAIGDYVFFTSKGTSNRLEYLCPIIIERKSVQDVAMSVYDGRWKSQKQRMYKGQYLFGHNKCRMVYIIEGNLRQQQVTGGYVGTRYHNVNEETLNKEVDNLKSEGFDVILTPSRENTMFELCRWAQRIAKDIRNGTLVAQYTFQEFKDKLKEIPPDTDFSRIAKYHAAQKIAAAASSQGDEVVDVDVSPEKVGSKSSKKPKKDGDDKFDGYSMTQLKDLCKSVGLPFSGKREDLIDRYRGPHPPKVWRLRKQRGQYVPSRHDVAGTALLVALYLHERRTGSLDPGLLKDELYVQAEALGITKNPFSGGTTQTGPYHYDGWSSMKALLKGDPALVIQSKKRFKLTKSCDLAGFKVAQALHQWCHQHGNCCCGNENA